MEALFERCFRGHRPTVLVVGDLMCDTYVSGTVMRLSPEAPVPIFESTAQRHVLGGAANVAANLSALGCQVRLLGAVGTDAAGHCLRELLHQWSIPDTWLLEDATRPTTEKTRLVAQQQQILRLDRESRAPLPAALLTQALRHVESLVPEIDGIVCSDYAKGVCSPPLLAGLFAVAQAANRPVMVDPKPSISHCIAALPCSNPMCWKPNAPVVYLSILRTPCTRLLSNCCSAARRRLCWSPVARMACRYFNQRMRLYTSPPALGKSMTSLAPAILSWRC